MKRKIFIILSLLIFTSSSYSTDSSIKLRGDFIYKGSEAITINATTLTNNIEIKKLKNNIKLLLNYANSQSVKIFKDNKNRKPRNKFKGAAEEIFRDYSKSVVRIGNYKDNTTGSGFIVKHQGLKIITNWHVVENAKNVQVCLKTENLDDTCYKDQYTGRVIKINKKKDLAMIEVKGLPNNLKSVSFGSYKRLTIGETVFAIGHPEGHLWSYTSGMVSSIRPNYKWRYKSSNHSANIIQTDASINQGNSGGPLFNKKKN